MSSETQSNVIQRFGEVQEPAAKSRPGAKPNNKNAAKHWMHSAQPMSGTVAEGAERWRELVRNQGGRLDVYRCLVCGDEREYSRLQFDYRPSRGPRSCAACDASKFGKWRRALQPVPPLPYFRLSLTDRYLYLEDRIVRAERWVQDQSTIANRKRKTLIPAIAELQSLVDSAVRIAGMLGIEPVKPPAPTLADLINRTSKRGRSQ